MVKGTIVKGIAGFYYVKADQTIYECKARGIFRKKNMTPIIGDHVLIHITNESEKEGRIEEILERKNSLIRPAVANVDQAMVVFSVSYPQIHLDLLDRFLIHIEKENILPCIILNKIDEGMPETYQYIVERYTKVGYEVLCLSAKKEIHTDLLLPKLRHCTTVFAGPSGVGKSTLINTIEKGLSLETGHVSDKIKRGKHTTRHVELIPLTDGGYVLDTPGFTSLQLDGIDPDELQYYFPEFKPYLGECKFRGCTHIHEPECMIRKALAENKIIQERYEAYCTFYKQLKESRRRY